MLEVLDAAHLSKHICCPFEQRGGIMLVGPPATLKTTFIKNVFENHHDALVMSDLNIQTLIKLRDDLRVGRYNTFAFTEFAKLYQRRGDTASNLEGSIAMLVEEGFHKASFEDQRMAIRRARCLVVGAMTNNFYEQHYDDWSKSGFLRRFLWSNINISNGYLLMDAIAKWTPLELGEYKTKTPGNKNIPYETTDTENTMLRKFIKEQPGEHTPFVLMKKILSVLKWKYAKENIKKPMAIMTDFAESLRREGGEITL